MRAPTLLTVCVRWPSLVEEVFPHWSRAAVAACLDEVVGPDWMEAALPEALLRLVARGLLRSPDEDPRDTFIAIRDFYLDRLWIRRAAALAHQEDAQ